jgi:hypothetical protein
MGVPLLKMSAVQSGGELKIDSVKGSGTSVLVSFKISHIDRPPMGDLAETMVTLIGGAKDTDFFLNYKVGVGEYAFSTKDVKEALGEDDLTDVTILSYLKEMISENIEKTNGGTIL